MQSLFSKMEKLRHRKITEQTRDHTVRHSQLGIGSGSSSSCVESDTFQEDDTHGLPFSPSPILARKFKVQCIAFSDQMGHCSERLEGTGHTWPMTAWKYRPPTIYAEKK